MQMCIINTVHNKHTSEEAPLASVKKGTEALAGPRHAWAWWPWEEQFHSPYTMVCHFNTDLPK